LTKELKTNKEYKKTRKLCYRRENRGMPLSISIPIEFYNDIVRFLCHSTAFLLVIVCTLQWIICQKVCQKEPVRSHI